MAGAAPENQFEMGQRKDQITESVWGMDDGRVLNNIRYIRRVRPRPLGEDLEDGNTYEIIILGIGTNKKMDGEKSSSNLILRVNHFVSDRNITMLNCGS